jgi:hypothetical protein
VEATANTFFSEMMLVSQDPCFGSDIIGLSRHFILRKKYQSTLNIIVMRNYQLLVHFTNNITDKPWLVCFHSWQEMLMAVLSHIGSVVSVKIEAFLVVDIFKALLVKPSPSSCQ